MTENSKGSWLYVAVALLVCAVIIAAVALMFLRRPEPQVNLPASESSQRIPPTSLVIEVTRDGTATFQGRTIPELQWPIETDRWLLHIEEYEGVLKPNGESRDARNLWGWDVPLIFHLDRELEFTLPRTVPFMNVWIETRNDNEVSYPVGLSFCLVDPADHLPDARGNIRLYWQGHCADYPFTKGCLSVWMSRGPRLRIRRLVTGVWLPKSGTGSWHGDRTMDAGDLPGDNFTLDEFREFLEDLGPGALLCVSIESPVSVQDVVDFMSMCKEIDQPWTFYVWDYFDSE
jgi:hypothetical protein